MKTTIILGLCRGHIGHHSGEAPRGSGPQVVQIP